MPLTLGCIRKFPGNLPIDPASAASGEISELTILNLLSRVDLHSEIPQEFSNGDGAVQRDLHSEDLLHTLYVFATCSLCSCGIHPMCLQHIMYASATYTLRI